MFNFPHLKIQLFTQIFALCTTLLCEEEREEEEKEPRLNIGLIAGVSAAVGIFVILALVFIIIKTRKHFKG